MLPDASAPVDHVESRPRVVRERAPDRVVVVDDDRVVDVHLPQSAAHVVDLALERELDPWEAWRATNGNTLRLGFAGILSLLPLLVPIGWAVIYLERTWQIPKLLIAPFASAVGTLAAMVSITLLSLSFNFFILRGDARR